jgi:hypothetical protein
MMPYDYYYIEDQVNFSALSATGWWLNYSSYNTGFLFNGGVNMQLQWDPAVLQSTNRTGIFYTTVGNTFMESLADHVIDQYSADILANSNSYNRALITYIGTYDYTPPATPPPLPDGLDGHDYGAGFTQGDVPMSRLTMQAIGPAGSAGAVRLSPSGNTGFLAAVGNGSGNQGTCQLGEVGMSNTWPRWEASVGEGEAPLPDGDGDGMGFYNEQIGWICIQ